MKKTMALLLCALMVLIAVADPGVAHAAAGGRPAAAAGGWRALEGEESPAVPADSGDEAPDAQESPTPGGDGAPGAQESPAPSGDETPGAQESPSPGGDEAPDTPENPGRELTAAELYALLMTLETEEEAEALLATLTPEQLAALEAYVQGLEEAEQAAPEPATPARNYTHAGPFKPPVDIQARVGAFAMRQAQNAAEEEDALVLDKTVSGADGSYLLTIEAYATGAVSITTGETPVPTDIILVLDTSGSMSGNMLSGYTPVTYATNRQAYSNRSGLLVKVNEQYYPVSISRTTTSEWYEILFPRYRYTYSYSIGGTPYSYVTDDDAADDSPPGWAFYRQATTSRIAALKTAANSFIDSIETKANSVSGGVDHRIAVVTFAGSAAIRSGSGTSGGAFVRAFNNAGGIDTLQSSIGGLSTGGATRADLGMGLAVNIFHDDLPAVPGPRNRVVVFFTDGTPTSDDTFSETVANNAIGYAKTLKASVSASPAGYGATVYSIGIFNGADPTAAIGTASNENRFMHFVSSNYPNASNMSTPGSGGNNGYYLSASNTTALNSIFKSISENIETGGTTVTLDETSVIRDVIAPYFKLPAGAVEDDIRVYTSEADENTGAWQARQPFSGTVSISADRRTIDVSGFDYAENYYAAIETNGQITGYQGKKLIIEIPIAYIAGSCFGGTVPTNKPVSGVYDGELFVEALPIPTVDIPVTYDFTPLNQSIYLTRDAAVDGMFTTAAGFVADGVNNAYVSIVYTVATAGGTATYTIPAGAATGSWNTTALAVSGLTANTPYTVSCTVTPVSGPVTPLTVNHTSVVYVWKPEVTFRDTVIYLGETANYDDNRVSAAWKNIAPSAPALSGSAPVLSYQYTPAAAAFAADTHVSVAVLINGANVTGHTSFVHAACGEAGCAFDPALGRFMVHVRTCSLTIQKTGARNTTDTFIFTVTGGGMTLRVSVQGNGSQTIVGLPAGTYTVTEASGWSWRYTASPAAVTLGRARASATVTVANTVTNDKWLGGDAHAVNRFLLAETEE